MLVALIVVCASRVWRARAVSRQAKPKRDAVGAKASPVSRPTRLRWLVLAAVPASLLVSVTSYVTTDFAVPLFWIAPLAIYLATFVLVFARRPILSHRLMSALLPFAVVVPLVLAAGQVRESLYSAGVSSGCAICGGDGVSRGTGSEPSPGTTSDGVLSVAVAWRSDWRSLQRAGGPVDLQDYGRVSAWPFAGLPRTSDRAGAQVKSKRMKAARSAWGSREHWLTLGIAVALGLLVLGLAFPAARLKLPPGSLRFVGVVFALPAIIALWFRQKRVRFAAGLGAIVLAAAFYSHLDQSVIARARSFYGVYFVANHGEYRVLVHGTTNHGAQSLRPQTKCIPLSYYFPTGPLGHLFRSFQGEQAKSDIAVVGLGAGSTAGYAQPGQRWTFYEIDPTVERIARDPRYFTLLRDCAPQAQVILGDARISLAREPDGTHDLIILDAFSSDAIPVHLLTREALDLYFRKLSPHGVLAFHISNRYFDLRPVLSRLARDAQLGGLPSIRCRRDSRRSARWQRRIAMGGHGAPAGGFGRTVARNAVDGVAPEYHRRSLDR